MNSRIAPMPQPPGRGPNGRRFCRICEVEVPKGRKTLCSDQCVEELLVRRDPSHARRRVWQRDRGVCASCGLDTDALKNAIEALRCVRWAILRDETVYAWSEQREELWIRYEVPAAESHYRLERARQVLAEHRYRPRRQWPGHYWEMDHVVPVVEGGGGCGLDNLRTLCVPCHRDVTRALHQRRRKRA
jgi:5-methylcytosine-specific restriction protein A